jgi:hypothetical protein
MTWIKPAEPFPQQPKMFITPFGMPRSVYPCFINIPIYFCMGEYENNGIGSWAMFIVEEQFARAELMPITLCYANDKTGVWRGGADNHWYTYLYATAEPAMLAWDYDPFLSYVNWCPGIAVANEHKIENWLTRRRDFCENILTNDNPTFLQEFKRQFVKGSFDDA